MCAAISAATRCCTSWPAERTSAGWKPRSVAWANRGGPTPETPGATGQEGVIGMTGGKRIRIGVVGAGLIGQVEHIPNLRRLERLFDIVGIADASADMRHELESRGHKAFR